MEDYPVQSDGGWGGDDPACVYVYALQEGVSVWQLGRLSLVGGGVVRHCGLPSLSCHKGCEKQIKFSFLLPSPTSPSFSVILISTLLFVFSFFFILQSSA